MKIERLLTEQNVAFKKKLSIVFQFDSSLIIENKNWLIAFNCVDIALGYSPKKNDLNPILSSFFKNIWLDQIECKWQMNDRN